MAILTVSREYGSGGRQIGLLTADALGLEFLDKEMIFSRVRTAGGPWEKWAGELDESTPGIWERYDWSFRGFVALVQHAIYEHASHDRVVVMGRGGNYLLSECPYMLSVRVTASFVTRVANVASRESIDLAKARDLVVNMDGERAGFLKTIYGRTGIKPTDYDLVVDTGKLSHQECISMISAGLSEKESFRTGAAEQDLKTRAEVARVKCGLLTNTSIMLPTLDVVLQGQTIVVSGIVHTADELAAVEKAADDLAVVNPLRFDLRFRK